MRYGNGMRGFDLTMLGQPLRSRQVSQVSRHFADAWPRRSFDVHYALWFKVSPLPTLAVQAQPRMA